MNWNDVLCGEIVTPEKWNGGLVECDGEWGMVDPTGNWDEECVAVYGVGLTNSLQSGIMTPAGNLQPVFPPRGWAGRTDAELWAAVFGLDEPWDDDGSDCLATVVLADMVVLDFEANPGVYALQFDIENERRGMKGGISLTEIPALINALNKAQWIARRLEAAHAQ